MAAGSLPLPWLLEAFPRTDPAINHRLGLVLQHRFLFSFYLFIFFFQITKRQLQLLTEQVKQR